MGRICVYEQVSEQIDLTYQGVTMKKAVIVKASLILCIALTISANCSYAKIYKYQDEN